MLGLGLVLHRPLAAVPENTLKYGVGLMLATFGTFWSLEGLGIFTDAGDSLEWPASDWALLVLLALWFVWSRILVAWLRREGSDGPRESTEVVSA